MVEEIMGRTWQTGTFQCMGLRTLVRRLTAGDVTVAKAMMGTTPHESLIRSGSTNRGLKKVLGPLNKREQKTCDWGVRAPRASAL